MAVAQHPRVAGERPVRAGGGGHVAGADWWTGPAGWRVGVAPVSRVRVLPHWVNSSLTDGHAYVTYGSTIWELVGTRIQYKFEILVVFLVDMDII